ncbi:uncharacterized protein LOC135694139 isoform X1 [Rhopilema esculentum]|uniref:uncharacterized protein LOC135694139 isoform X1 n=1 Tax=Rhopilema esculentum TaxID=499914 RepID=UPI0031DF8C05
MQKVMVGQVPHLCLFATRTITQGEELRYDYGLDDLPWRKQEGVAKGKRKKTLKADHEEIGQAKSQEKQREGVAKGKRKKTLKADHEEIGQAKSQEKQQEGVAKGKRKKTLKADHEEIGQAKSQGKQQEGVAERKGKKTLKADHEEIGQAKSQGKQQVNLSIFFSLQKAKFYLRFESSYLFFMSQLNFYCGVYPTRLFGVKSFKLLFTYI